MILARNNITIWCQIDQFVGYAQIWDGSRKNPSILSLNLISLGDLFKPPKGAFPQEGINM
jgi:hypothetical protein